jgi:hypothetical protein
MGRAFAGILLGIAIAVALVFVIERVAGLIYPLPPDFNMQDPEAVRARIASLPMWVILAVMLGWLVGTGLGAWAAVRIARTAKLWPGLTVAGVIFLATLYNVVTIPHPVWFVALSLVTIPIAGWLGAKAGRRPRIEDGGTGMTSPLPPSTRY